MPDEPPYRRIVAELRARILDGDLRPGDRMPSIRQVAQRWGVAVATATRVMAALRDEGLVEARVGAGTVVSARTAGRSRPLGPATAPRPQRAGGPRQALSRDHVLRAAIAIADAEGLDAVSMRRLAAELGAGPMSLYRHVATKDELVTQMVDEVFGEPELPTPGPDGWRAKLELISREQWELSRRHLWLARAVSFTRPLLVPNMMAHTEWTLRALDGLGLPMETCIQEALTLHGLVVTVALTMAEEAEAEQETGVTLTRWWLAQRDRAGELLAGGRFPLLATVAGQTVSDLDGLFEYSLARHLDGFAALLEGRSRTRS
ncbi:TetR/AcrR family transcriptional regulator C-terminal domain-containing protein [Nonomuraea zeae]|uniref:GntR family transcriptional regulator n=1 Tax=Nonomuraea zeae TaxID=1642303 RepID=A0A5S4G2M3_9ACTN|nr:GntR family transcriptional regulator [Nonomuraea zeae]TMR26651.1 GntR family transcriptional regulator [Nonomuraea zeae]